MLEVTEEAWKCNRCPTAGPGTGGQWFHRYSSSGVPFGFGQEVRQLKEHLIQIANTTYGSRYIFGGPALANPL